jgi:hypothetical protein
MYIKTCKYFNYGIVEYQFDVNLILFILKYSRRHQLSIIFIDVKIEVEEEKLNANNIIKKRQKLNEEENVEIPSQIFEILKAITIICTTD